MNKIYSKLITLVFATLFAVGLSAQCQYTLEATDTWGDGWNGGVVVVNVNGVTVLFFGGPANGTGPETATFNTMPGDVIDISYVDANFDGENNLTITDCAGNIVFMDNMGNFDGNDADPELLISTVAPDPVDLCTYTVTKTDSWGDGWNGNSVVVSSLGTTLATVSLGAGATGSCDISIPIGVPVDFTLDGAGAFVSEIGYGVLDSEGNVIFDANDPTPGGQGTSNPNGPIVTGTPSFSTVSDCAVCGLVCPSTGSGTYIEQHFLGAGECTVQVVIPIEITGDCEVVTEGIAITQDASGFLVPSNGAAPGETNTFVEDGVLILEESDPVAFGGGGANNSAFFASTMGYTLPADGMLCFDYEVTVPGGGGVFGYSLGLDWNVAIANPLIIEDTSVPVAVSADGPVTGNICINGNQDQIFTWIVYSDFFTNGNSFVAGAMTIAISNMEFSGIEQVVETIPAGTIDYITTLEEGLGQFVTISYTLTNGAVISCDVPVDVFPYSGPVTTALVCNDDVNISLDENCEVTLGADMFLEGGPYSCYDDYVVRIRPYGGSDYLTIDPAAADPYNANTATLSLPGGQHIYEIIDLNTGNTCWGYFTIEDKFAPTLDCECPEGGDFFVSDPITGTTAAGDPVANWDNADICTTLGGDGVDPLGGDFEYGEYVFTTNCRQEVVIDAITSWGDGQLYVYDQPVNTADICEGIIGWDGDSGPGFDPVVTLTLDPGTYYVYISSWNGGTGDYTINSTGSVCGLSFDGVPFITTVSAACSFLCYDETNWEVIDELPTPTIVDNCGAGDLASNDVWLDGECGQRILIRNWLLTDPNTGETSTCSQQFNFNAITAADLTLPPATVILDCGGASEPSDLGITEGFPHYFVGDKTYDDDGNFIGYTQRAVAVDNNVCNLFASYTDVDISDCPGCPGNKKVIRSWEILDWCNSSTTPYTQVIKASDSEAPTVSAPDVTVSVNPWTCTADFYLPCPEHLHDDCYGDNLNYEVVGPAGVTITQVPSTLCASGYQYVASGAPKTMYDNPHVFTYVATDCCGNVGTYDMNVTVLDNTPPVAIAKENIVISLTSTPGQTNGVAKMYPQSVDNGSHDGDCGPVYLEIRRADGAPACDNLGEVVSDEDEAGKCDDATEVEVQNGSVYLCYYNNNITFNNDRLPLVPEDAQHADDNRYDNDGGAYVKFCCEDLTEVNASGTAYGLVEVLIRVWDDGNMTGQYGDWVDLNGDGDFQDIGELDNYSDTWAYVRVEDKLAPQIVCPADITLKCDQDYTDIYITGSASASATCSGIGVTYTDDTNISTCGAGIVERTWCVEGTSNCCVQKITVDYFSTWDPCNRDTGIVWPADYTGEEDPQVPWCGKEIKPKDAIDCADTDTGKPVWTDSPCDLIGYSLDSDTFYFEGNACFKVLNNWSVINWCIYNPNDADWNGIPNEGLDPDNDGIPNALDIDDDGNGNEDSYYYLPGVDDVRFYFDTEGGLYAVVDNQFIVREYSIDIWDLVLVDSDNGYFGEFDPEREDDGIADGLYEHTQVIKLIDEAAPEISTPELCVPVDETCYASTGNGKYGPVIEATACDTLSDCNSDWIKWLVEVDVWGDWTIDYTYSSFIADVPANNPTVAGSSTPFFVDPTQSCDAVSIILPTPVEGSKYQHRVLWRATDGCGNVTSYTSYFTVEDKKAPTPYCINLSTALMENGEVELWACDFDAGAFDNCTPGDWLRFTFNGPEDGFYSPEETPNYDPTTRCQGKTFDCGHLELAAANGGLYPVRVYVWDECNNVDFCMVNLRLIDNQGGCGGTTGASRIGGEITTADGGKVANATVEFHEMSGTMDMISALTDDQGHYDEWNTINMDYEVSAEKNDDYLNGVSTLDLVLIQKHILGLQTLDSAYKLIAADASNDEKVSAIDLVQLRKLILGINDVLPNNGSWRFVDADQTLNVESPWPFTEKLLVSNLSTDMMSENFIGVKVGDVNGSVVTGFAGAGNVDARTANKLVLNAIPTLNGEGTVSIDVTANNFNDVFGLQFTLETPGMELTNVEAGALNVTAENFAVVNGKVTSSWNSEVAVSTSDVLFTLTFSGSNVENALAINSSITSAEAYVGENLEIVGLELAGTADNDFALLQNEPNPFNNVTIVGFNLPVDGQATLTVYDVTGKVISTVNGAYSQGYNEIELSKKDMSTSGVLYYQLESGDYTATKKMIILD